MGKMDNKSSVQVECPVCGYRMPIFYDRSAECRGVSVVCKGRKCGHKFEVIIRQGTQVK